MKKQVLSLFAVGSLALAFASCGDDSSTTTTTTTTDTAVTAPAVAPAAPVEEAGVMVGGAKMVASKDIVDNAANSADHTTLVAAVKQAGLVETLKGAGPFTVFAPTNAAFDAVGKEKIDNLMKDENKDKLKNVLTYHVVAGKIMAADLKDGDKLKTVQGKELKVSVKDGKVMVGDATVTTADAVSSNGVTHVIDKVLMP